MTDTETDEHNAESKRFYRHGERNIGDSTGAADLVVPKGIAIFFADRRDNYQEQIAQVTCSIRFRHQRLIYMKRGYESLPAEQAAITRPSI